MVLLFTPIKQKVFTQQGLSKNDKAKNKKSKSDTIISITRKTPLLAFCNPMTDAPDYKIHLIKFVIEHQLSTYITLKNLFSKTK